MTKYNYLFKIHSMDKIMDSLDFYKIRLRC